MLTEQHDLMDEKWTTSLACCHPAFYPSRNPMLAPIVRESFLLTFYHQSISNFIFFSTRFSQWIAKPLFCPRCNECCFQYLPLEKPRGGMGQHEISVRNSGEFPYLNQSSSSRRTFQNETTSKWVKER